MRPNPNEHEESDRGYELLADCVEHRGEASRARAQRSFDEETYSSLRRRIRHGCLEPAPDEPLCVPA